MNMGNKFASPFNGFFEKKHHRTLIMGLDGSGKTTVLYKLKLGEDVITIPTIGYNHEYLQYKNRSFNIFDLGGGDKIKPLLRAYFDHTEVIIFIVDSTDRERFHEMKDWLSNIRCEDMLRNTIFLVLANKQDLPNAASPIEIAEKLNVLSKQSWQVQGTCAKTGDGLYYGLDWICEQIGKLESSNGVLARLQSSLVTSSTKMGNIFADLLNTLFRKKPVRILMLGLDAAGKTTVLFKLKVGDVFTTIPTIGFNVDTLEYKNISFTVWDVGGQDKIRPLWKHYYPNTQGIIFVVDSNNRDRIDEARDVLIHILAEEDLKKSVLLIFANKQDLPNAMNAIEMTDHLGLQALKNRNWHIQPTCATSGDGLYEGLGWMSDQIKCMGY